MSVSVYSHERIRELLPHRHPMLLVDRIVSVEPWSRIVGLKAVTGTDFCYLNVQDRAPLAAYAYPRSLMMESFGQTGGVLINERRRAAGTPEQVMLAAGVFRFEFFEDVFPGDTMCHRVVIDKEMDDSAILGGEIWVGERRVAEIEGMIVAYRPFDGPGQGHGQA